MAKMKRGKVSDFTPDPKNANAGTMRGLRLLEDSLRESGAGRSLLADKNGVLLAGNKTAERAVDIGLENAVIVETDGTEVVIVKRTDLDINTPEGRAMAYRDNRVGELDLSWQPEQLIADMQAGLFPEGLFDTSELDAMIAAVSQASDSEWGNAFAGVPDGDKAPFQQMTFTLHDTQAEVVKQAIKSALQSGEFADSPNANSNGNALTRICEAYLHG